MATARLTDNLAEVLARATEPVTIRAADGRVVGVFEPYDDRQEPPCPYTDEQLEEFRRNKGACRPLDEVLRRIGAE
jgi:hypothetical protein